jgi:Glycosyltransferase family 87
VAVSDRVEHASDPQKAAQSPMPSGGGQRTARRSLFTWIDVARLLSVAFLATIVFTDFADPGATDSSDYVSSFYVAGRLAAAGEFDRLYPGPDAVSFRDSPFNDSAHQLLPRLHKGTTTNFMYPPIVAWVFAPLSVLPPHVSLLVWQAISLSALGLACLLLSRTADVRARDLFLLSSLFFPTFMAVLIGQAGIPFGLLPLSIGYWLVSRGSPLAAGFAWAGLALKPQFLPAAGLMSMAYAVTGRMRLLSGMILGLCVWVALNYFLVPEGTLAAWIRSLRVSDAIFSRDEYQVPLHLLASIPADLMMRSSPEARVWLKPVLYGLSVGLGLLALWQCRKILRSRLPEELGRLAVFTTSLAILPLTSPHLLYYDLVTLFPMGLILLDSQWSRPPLEGLRRMVIVSWSSIGAYFLFFSFVGHFSPSSLILLVILFATWTLFLLKAVDVSTMAVWRAADRD